MGLVCTKVDPGASWELTSGIKSKSITTKRKSKREAASISNHADKHTNRHENNMKRKQAMNMISGKNY